MFQNDQKQNAKLQDLEWHIGILIDYEKTQPLNRNSDGLLSTHLRNQKI